MYLIFNLQLIADHLAFTSFFEWEECVGLLHSMDSRYQLLGAFWLLCFVFFPHFHLTRPILDTHFPNPNAFSRLAKAECLLFARVPLTHSSRPATKACESCAPHVTRPARRLASGESFANLTLVLSAGLGAEPSRDGTPDPHVPGGRWGTRIRWRRFKLPLQWRLRVIMVPSVVVKRPDCVVSPISASSSLSQQPGSLLTNPFLIPLPFLQYANIKNHYFSSSPTSDSHSYRRVRSIRVPPPHF